MNAELKRRSTKSFAVLLLFIIIFIGTWTWLKRQPGVDETPKPFRQVLELNGAIWQALFNPTRLVHSPPPPEKKIPRVNGTLGLSENINPENWRLEVTGDDEDDNSPHLSLTLRDLQALPRTDSNTQLRCVEGWSENMSFAGVKFSDFVQAYKLKTMPYVGLETEDGNYYVSVDIESMMHPQTLLAYEMNGAPLLPRNGAPLRLVIPTKYGIKNLKQISRIFLSATRPPDFWAERGYDWFAGL